MGGLGSGSGSGFGGFGGFGGAGGGFGGGGAGGTNCLLLNYLTAPNVLLWSAVAASCALPGLMRPVTLMAVDHRGRVVPFHTTSSVHSIDGSFAADIPYEQLSLLFHANRIIVSQTNPHVLPFLSDGQSFLQSTIDSSFLSRAIVMLEQYLHLDVRARVKHLAHLKLLPSWFGFSASRVFLQKYSGYNAPTITPQQQWLSQWRALSQPSRTDMEAMILEGQRATWRHLSHIRCIVTIEKKLSECARRFLHQSAPAYGFGGSGLYAAPIAMPPAGVTRVHPSTSAGAGLRKTPSQGQLAAERTEGSGAAGVSPPGGGGGGRSMHAASPMHGAPSAATPSTGLVGLASRRVASYARPLYTLADEGNDAGGGDASPLPPGMQNARAQYGTQHDASCSSNSAAFTSFADDGSGADGYPPSGATSSSGIRRRSLVASGRQGLESPELFSSPQSAYVTNAPANLQPRFNSGHSHPVDVTPFSAPFYRASHATAHSFGNFAELSAAGASGGRRSSTGFLRRDRSREVLYAAGAGLNADTGNLGTTTPDSRSVSGSMDADHATGFGYSYEGSMFEDYEVQLAEGGGSPGRLDVGSSMLQGRALDSRDLPPMSSGSPLPPLPPFRAISSSGALDSLSSNNTPTASAPSSFPSRSSESPLPRGAWGVQGVQSVRPGSASMPQALRLGRTESPSPTPLSASPATGNSPGGGMSVSFARHVEVFADVQGVANPGLVRMAGPSTEESSDRAPIDMQSTETEKSTPANELQQRPETSADECSDSQIMDDANRGVEQLSPVEAPLPSKGRGLRLEYLDVSPAAVRAAASAAEASDAARSSPHLECGILTPIPASSPSATEAFVRLATSATVAANQMHPRDDVDTFIFSPHTGGDMGLDAASLKSPSSAQSAPADAGQSSGAEDAEVAGMVPAESLIPDFALPESAVNLSTYSAASSTQGVEQNASAEDAAAPTPALPSLSTSIGSSRMHDLSGRSRNAALPRSGPRGVAGLPRLHAEQLAAGFVNPQTGLGPMTPPLGALKGNILFPRLS
jgi:hypothetical protein